MKHRDYYYSLINKGIKMIIQLKNLFIRLFQNDYFNLRNYHVKNVCKNLLKLYTNYNITQMFM